MVQWCICRTQQFENPTRSRRDIPRKLQFEISNFWRHCWPEIRMTAQKIVFPDQGEIGPRQS